MDSAWNEEVAASAPAPAPLAPGAVELEQAFSQAWNESMDGKDVDFSKVWENAMDSAEVSAAQAQAGSTESLFQQAFTQAQTPADGLVDSPSPADMPYVMEGENPFADHAQPYEEGLRFFNEGNLHDAVLAFEAAVEKEPNHADAWRMLGKTHQEHDEDRKAIACLERAVEHDAYHLDALLELGVSYVNELNQERALKNLMAWVVNNPNFQGLEVKQDEYSDGSLMDDVMQLMLEAQKWAPHDPDVQEVLGVLYNVSRDYASATKAFRSALEQKPEDYSLWNKLGATLANGSLSQEAIPAYLRALELKPKYARGWLNLGISHSNLGTYDEAAKCYLKALSLNNNATHIWSYLRICFTCMERYDLVNVADRLNIDEFRTEFEF
jgi:peroxin-5